ncbi:hypothetical protein KP509_36G034600 [Ceratopteris richardii]|nr:hypothetical protein KP509_36G034600 [Ceratopteris richardii]
MQVTVNVIQETVGGVSNSDSFISSNSFQKSSEAYSMEPNSKRRKTIASCSIQTFDTRESIHRHGDHDYNANSMKLYRTSKLMVPSGCSIGRDTIIESTSERHTEQHNVCKEGGIELKASIRRERSLLADEKKGTSTCLKGRAQENDGDALFDASQCTPPNGFASVKAALSSRGHHDAGDAWRELPLSKHHGGSLRLERTFDQLYTMSENQLHAPLQRQLGQSKAIVLDNQTKRARTPIHSLAEAESEVEDHISEGDAAKEFALGHPHHYEVCVTEQDPLESGSCKERQPGHSHKKASKASLTVMQSALYQNNFSSSDDFAFQGKTCHTKTSMLPEKDRVLSGEADHHGSRSTSDDKELACRKHAHQEVGHSIYNLDIVTDTLLNRHIEKGNRLKKVSEACLHSEKNNIGVQTAKSSHEHYLAHPKQGSQKVGYDSLSAQQRGISDSNINNNEIKRKDQGSSSYVLEISPCKVEQGVPRQSKILTPTKRPNASNVNSEKISNKFKANTSLFPRNGRNHEVIGKLQEQIFKPIVPGYLKSSSSSRPHVDAKSCSKSSAEILGMSKLHGEFSENKIRAAVEAAKEAQKVKDALVKQKLAQAASAASKIPETGKVLDECISSPAHYGSSISSSPSHSQTVEHVQCSFEVLGTCKNSSPRYETGETNFSQNSNRTEIILSEDTEASVARDTFEGMLETLSRTKDSIARSTRQALVCANFGMAALIVDIIIKRMEAEPSLHRRVDLLFLVDSITQLSVAAQGSAGIAYPRAVQAVLPRLLSAAAPSGSSAHENQRQCLKILNLWSSRKIMPDSVLRSHIIELDSSSSYNDKASGIPSKKHPCMERGVDDPIREMDGMCVDEYGSNAAFGLRGLVPHSFEDDEDFCVGSREGGDAFPSRGSDLEHCSSTSPLSSQKHNHILEDVEGELEMEDALPEGSIRDDEVTQNFHSPSVPPAYSVSTSTPLPSPDFPPLLVLHSDCLPLPPSSPPPPPPPPPPPTSLT